MVHPFKFQGLWNLPGRESDDITGTLHFDLENSRIELSLVGSLEEGRSLEGGYRDLIVGTNEKGKEITLYQCRMVSYRETGNGIKTSTYRVNVVFIGAQFTKIEDLSFDSISGDFSNLFDWVGVSGILNERVDLGSVKLEYKRPENIEVELSKELSAKFSFGYHFPLPDQNISLTQSISFDIFSKEPASFKKLVSDLFHFKDFLSLAQFESIKVTAIDVSTSRIYTEYSGKQYPKRIEVYLFGDWAKSPRSKSRHQMLFNYKDIAHNFAIIIKRWYEIKEKLSPSIGFMVDSLASDRVLTVNSFLNIIQAVETFHRRFRKNNLMPPGDYKAMKNNILDDVRSEYKNWLTSRLHFANEPTLHNRLEELISETRNEILTGVIDDEGQFIRDAKNSRNYYTHYDPILKKKAKTGSALFLLTEKLKVLLLCAILNETGFDKGQIERLLKERSWVLFNHILPRSK